MCLALHLELKFVVVLSPNLDIVVKDSLFDGFSIISFLLEKWSFLWGKLSGALPAM